VSYFSQHRDHLSSQTKMQEITSLVFSLYLVTQVMQCFFTCCALQLLEVMFLNRSFLSMSQALPICVLLPMTFALHIIFIFPCNLLPTTSTSRSVILLGHEPFLATRHWNSSLSKPPQETFASHVADPLIPILLRWPFTHCAKITFVVQHQT
jgi:hypothetical protein